MSAARAVPAALLRQGITRLRNNRAPRQAVVLPAGTLCAGRAAGGLGDWLETAQRRVAARAAGAAPPEWPAAVR